MKLISITPGPGGHSILRWYEVDHSAASDEDRKSFAVTAPSVASRMLNRCSLRGIRPATYREIAAWRTPIISANLVCEMALTARNSDSFIPVPYHDGMEIQGPYTSMVLDGREEAQYRIGMSALRDLRRKHKLSQPGLADKIGTQQPQIWRWEAPEDHPDHRKPPIKWAMKLAEFFKVDWTVFRPDIQRAGGIDAVLQWEAPETRAEIYRMVIERLSKRPEPTEEQEDVGKVRRSRAPK